MESYLRDSLGWFGRNLEIPQVLESRASKASNRKYFRAVSYFKDSADIFIERAEFHAALLRLCDVDIEVCRCFGNLGYVYYEDEIQTVIRPFHEGPGCCPE